jgi:hypothetical protein
MNLRMSSKGRLLVDKAAGIDRDALLDWESDVIEGDRIDASAIQWMQNQPFTGAVTQQMLQLQSDIKQDSGQNQFTRGETAGGVTAASAISALQEAGGKITRLRTNVLNQGFKSIAEQVMWLINQYYDKKRVLMVTGQREGAMEQREVSADPERLFGKASKGAMPPPPYTVQIQIQRRNPLRQQAQNELFMQAYSMAAQAGAQFPLSVLFQLLHVDGKERILPVLKEFDMQAQQLQQMAAQVEQLTSMNQELQTGMANKQKVIDRMMAGQRGAGGMYPSAQESDAVLGAVEGAGL